MTESNPFSSEELRAALDLKARAEADLGYDVTDSLTDLIADNFTNWPWLKVKAVTAHIRAQGRESSNAPR